MTLRCWTAERLESGAFRGAFARGAAVLWACSANPVRPVKLPTGAFVVGVGGATLGGAGKTPVVLQLARALAERGSVVVVASGYRARVPDAHLVRPDDDVRQVGDEALLLARELLPLGVPTVVGRRRQAALDRAATLGSTVLVDGLLQARPDRLGRSVLVLDADAPWGSGRCPPAGDLRADRALLLEAADVVVAVGDHDISPTASATERELASLGAFPRFRPTGASPLPILQAGTELLGARTPDGRLVAVDELAHLRLGLVLAIARPQRVVRSLAARDVVPTRVEIYSDHGLPGGGRGSARPPPPRSGPGLDAWLTTSKCATKLDQSYRGAPLWTLDRRLDLPPRLVDLCTAR